ncbi:MAG TPA: ABC transporter permease subunit [Candidatus Sumerlaeota bacterium]|nr:ABC transporter permease subunit [Candidatus Sumerlaeota bacterium]
MNFLPIYRRELKTYFQSPSTYIVMALLFLVLGMIYSQIMVLFSNMSAQAGMPNMFGQTPPEPNVTEMVIRSLFQIMIALILFTVPLLSMRLVAEEKSRGTFELLVTCPISDWAILMGKYLALVTVGVIVILLSGLFPVITWWAGRGSEVVIEWPIVLSCWLGLLLIFAAYAAFGVMASSFSENQITAGVITLIGLIMCNMLASFQIESFPRIQQIFTELAAEPHTRILSRDC